VQEKPSGWFILSGFGPGTEGHPKARPARRHSEHTVFEHTVFESEFTRVQKAKLNLHKFYTFLFRQSGRDKVVGKYFAESSNGVM
jgi:hypothetical protein